jgi:replicative DNA helicase
MGELFDQQAESGVVASILYDPEKILSSEDWLTPSDFYDTSAGCIYWAVQELVRKQESVDAFSVTQQLNSNQAVARTIEQYNLPHIQELFELSAVSVRQTQEDYLECCHIVHDFACKRALEKQLNMTLRSLARRDKSVENVIESISDGVESISTKYIINDQLNPFGERVDDLWSEMVSRRRNGNEYGVSWKWDVLNKYATLENGELYLIQGKQKAGKSVVLMNQALYMLEKGMPVLVFDTEMQDRLYFERVLSNLTGVNLHRIKSGDYSKDEECRIRRAIEWLKEQQFYHIYMPDSFDKTKVFNICKILQRKVGLEVVVFDYLKSNQTDASANYNLLGDYTDFLHNRIAGELNMIVLSAAQLNRAGEVADSMKINRYASFACKWSAKPQQLVMQDGQECGNAMMQVYLNRLGEQCDLTDETDYIDFFFDGSKMQVVQAKEHDRNSLEEFA